MRGLYNAAGSMLVNQVKMENISNNLSNLNTPGYKRNDVVQRTFPEVLLYRTEKKPFTRGGLHGPVGIAAENVALEEIPAIHLPGSLLTTGRKLDVALQEDGFFMVETPEGMRYTRDGHFHLSQDGVLVNARGYPVWGLEGPVLLEDENPFVDRSGHIYVDGEHVNTIRVVSFEEGTPLWKEGYTLFQVGEGFEPQVLENPVVFQGALESSNTDLSRQMTDMIRVRRTYEAAQKIAQVYDTLLSRAANDLGALG